MGNDDRFMVLRQKAQTLLSNTDNERLREQFGDIEKLLEELNIHQIELEMQQEELEKANRQIESERQKYMDLYSDAPIAYFTLNETGNILQLNQAAAALLDTPIHQFKYTSIFPYLDNDSRIALSRFFRELFSSGRREDTELTFVTRNGEHIFTRVQAAPYVDPQDNIVLVRLTATNLTPLKRVEAELEHQRSIIDTFARYRSFFSDTSAGFGITDSIGTIVDCNDALIEMLGYERDEVLGTNIQKFNHPDDVAREEQIVQMLSPEAARTRLEKRLVRKDGREIWVDLNVSALSQENETFYIGVLIDISDRVFAQQTIKLLNNRLEASMRAGSMAWWELKLPSGEISFNERKATLLGYDPSGFTHYEDFMKLVHPDDYEPTMEAFRQHLYGPSDVYECEYRIRHVAGHYLWFHDIGKITERIDGTVTLTGIITEITELKETREALETANRQLLTVLENLQVGVLVIKKDEQAVIYSNSYIQKMYDQPLDGRKCQEIFSGDTGTDSICSGECNEELPALEHYISEIDRWFFLQRRSIRWVDGTSAILLILTDISALKEVAELKEDIDRITQHDLKNPLHGIMGAAQLLLTDDDPPLSETHEELVQMVYNAGKRILTMVDQSLGLYKMEKGIYEVEAEPVDLRHVINMIALELQIESLEDGADADPPVVAQGEPLLCYSIFSNLLKNAADASNQHDRIRIVYERPENGTVRVSIWNPNAIPREIRTKFGKKYSTWGKRHGTGLGVYSADLMARTQGGSLSWTTSDTEGTTISVTLPAAESGTD